MDNNKKKRKSEEIEEQFSKYWDYRRAGIRGLIDKADPRKTEEAKKFTEKVFLAESEHDTSDIDKVIESGSPIDKALLVVRNQEFRRKHNKPLFKDDVLKRLGTSVKGNREVGDKMFSVILAYRNLIDYGNTLKLCFKIYQLEATILMKLTTQWESADNQARNYTKTMNTFTESGLAFCFIKKEDPSHFYLIPKEKDSNRLLANEGLKIEYPTQEGFIFHYDEKEKKFVAEIDINGEVYAEICEEIADARKYLSELKAHIVAVLEFFEEEDLYCIIPNSMYQLILSTFDEGFLRFLDGRLQYYESELHDRIERGETITEEDIRRAVYPDYFTTPVDEKKVAKYKKELYKKIPIC